MVTLINEDEEVVTWPTGLRASGGGGAVGPEGGRDTESWVHHAHVLMEAGRGGKKGSNLDHLVLRIPSPPWRLREARSSIPNSSGLCVLGQVI